MRSAMSVTRLLYISLCSLTVVAAAAATDQSGVLSEKDAGARGDGTNDDTVALQKMLDVAGKNGGVVSLAPERYLVKGSLHIPPGVTLQGIHDAPVWSAPLKGSVILATGGRDHEKGPALFEMGHSSLAACRA
jgi:hypothetical protein